MWGSRVVSFFSIGPYPPSQKRRRLTAYPRLNHSQICLPHSASAIQHFSVLLPFAGVLSPSRVSLRGARQSGRWAASSLPRRRLWRAPGRAPHPGSARGPLGRAGCAAHFHGQWHLASVSDFVALVRKTSESCLLLPNVIIIPFPLPSHLNSGIIFSIFYGWYLKSYSTSCRLGKNHIKNGNSSRSDYSRSYNGNLKIRILPFYKCKN